MRYQFRKVAVASAFCLAVMSGRASAQLDMPTAPTTYLQDAQLFAPAETDLDGLIIGEDTRNGAFFIFDELYWATSAEQVTVGTRGLHRALPETWFDSIQPDNPLTLLPGTYLPGQPVDPVTGRPINPDTGLPIQRPVYSNSIENAPPFASFRNGQRYTFGWTDEGHGWMVGILDGPEQQTGQFYGTNGGMQEGQGELMLPFGDVYIAFEYEPGFMHGFQDIVVGPIGTGDVLPADTDGDGILDGDGIADDVDGDGQYGADGFDQNNPARVPDSYPQDGTAPFPATESFIPDYGDLVELPTSFRTVLVRNAATTNGVELMATHRLSNRNWMAKHQNYNNIDLYYGVRYVRFRDNFVINTEGGVLGTMFIDSQITNNIVGPQLGLNWTQMRGRWTSSLNGRFQFGYNVSNWSQDGNMGEDLTPGRINHPLYLRPFWFKSAHQDNDFSPVAEMRWEVAYNFTKSVAVKAGWSGIYMGNVYRASTHTRYRLPEMGFLFNDPESVLVQGGNIGLEFNY